LVGKVAAVSPAVATDVGPTSKRQRVLVEVMAGEVLIGTAVGCVQAQARGGGGVDQDGDGLGARGGNGRGAYVQAPARAGGDDGQGGADRDGRGLFPSASAWRGGGGVGKATSVVPVVATDVGP
jgi:hypothetical protein